MLREPNEETKKSLSAILFFVSLLFVSFLP